MKSWQERPRSCSFVKVCRCIGRMTAPNFSTTIGIYLNTKSIWSHFTWYYFFLTTITHECECIKCNFKRRRCPKESSTHRFYLTFPFKNKSHHLFIFKIFTTTTSSSFWFFTFLSVQLLCARPTLASKSFGRFQFCALWFRYLSVGWSNARNRW